MGSAPILRSTASRTGLDFNDVHAKLAKSRRHPRDFKGCASCQCASKYALSCRPGCYPAWKTDPVGGGSASTRRRLTLIAPHASDQLRASIATENRENILRTDEIRRFTRHVNHVRRLDLGGRYDRGQRPRRMFESLGRSPPIAADPNILQRRAGSSLNTRARFRPSSPIR